MFLGFPRKRGSKGRSAPLGGVGLSRVGFLGVQGAKPPYRGFGCPQCFSFFLSPPPAARKTGKRCFAGTPRTPAKGSPPFAIPLGERVAKKPTPESLPPTRHARRDTPTFYHHFSSSGFPHPLARLELRLIMSKIVRGPLRGPGSDPRTPSSATPPPCHLPSSPRRVAPLPFDPCALIARSTLSAEPGGLNVAKGGAFTSGPPLRRVLWSAHYARV